ncbi:mitochondrial fission ELM1 family protein [Marinobacter sediminum]|uniref:mitochondrial fission ELM1 family protein n=1 Tax=Marinobacter sediminum TaxID=256323 RepID=UPI003567DB1B
MTNPTDRNNGAPAVWLLTDNKAGHRNQLKGLGNRLRVLTGASLHWIDASEVEVPVWRALLGIAPTLNAELPAPNLIVAAGTGTHRLLLSLRRVSRAKTLTLMKPGFPLSWVDGVITPAHDAIHSKHVLLTEGALNSITPLARITDKPEALILLGGPSPHFEWDNDVLLGQINNLIGQYPAWRWTIGGSRRTPEELLARLAELQGPKITVVHPNDTHQDWLSHQLAASRAAWVTPDSMSMVCEAATAGVPTGIFELAARPASRVAQGIGHLVENGRIAHWTDHAAVMAGDTVPTATLWESDRVARWVIDRHLPASRAIPPVNTRITE